MGCRQCALPGPGLGRSSVKLGLKLAYCLRVPSRYTECFVGQKDDLSTTTVTIVVGTTTRTGDDRTGHVPNTHSTCRKRFAESLLCNNALRISYYVHSAASLRHFEIRFTAAVADPQQHVELTADCKLSMCPKMRRKVCDQDPH
jgi:hypothetical protein